tara:strand:+ start:1158 stop:1346 length:189 start_codon:yes stop_codon:yes gene_type:complete
VLKKIIILTISSSFLLSHNSKPAYAADCENHLSRPGANRAKEMARKRKSLKKFEDLEELKSE